MKRIPLYIIVSTLATFFFVVLPKSILADVNVDVSNNAGGSNNNVSIDNEVNNTVDTGNTSQTNTTVTINGKTYHSDQPGELNYQSDDGHSTVHINNQVGGTSVNTQSNQNIQNNVHVNTNTSNNAPSSLSTTPEPTHKEFKTNKSSFDFSLFMDFFKNFLKNFHIF